MKLLKEYVKLLVEQSEDENVEVSKNYTYKELYDFLRFVKHGKNAKKALGFVASVTGGAGLEGLMNMSSVTEETASKVLDKFLSKLNLPKGNPLLVLKKFYGINDAQGLKNFYIPNGMSNLIDDEVENRFLANLLPDLKLKAESNPEETVDADFVKNKLIAYTRDRDKKTKGYYPEN